MLARLVRAIRREPEPDPTQDIAPELEAALSQRDRLLERKEDVLRRFRKAHDALTERRRVDRGHRPERRGI